MNEKLSAWIDGELASEDARHIPLQLRHSADLRGNWDCYHLIGDAMRGVHGPDLCAKICARLDAEPTVLAPHRRSAAEWLHWRPLQVAASVAALIFVGGVWTALPGMQQDAPQVTAKADVRQVAVPAGEGAKDYLLAHQRYSPSNAMQGVAPYVRTVAEERRVPRR
jgi:sigma-E factor negative regulatory protein RseA